MIFFLIRISEFNVRNCNFSSDKLTVDKPLIGVYRGNLELTAFIFNSSFINIFANSSALISTKKHTRFLFNGSQFSLLSCSGGGIFISAESYNQIGLVNLTINRFEFKEKNYVFMKNCLFFNINLTLNKEESYEFGIILRDYILNDYSFVSCLFLEIHIVNFRMTTQPTLFM